MSKILIVEDEITISQPLEIFLKSRKFQVKILDSGLNVINTVKETLPDLIILDLMLPYKDGITCCKEIRGFSEVPIIILTAKGEEIDRLIGLNAGADDYVCKPFSLAELALRIKAILKRSNAQDPHNGLELNTATSILSFNRNNCELTSRELSLFSLLYSRPGRIYSREQIIEIAYPHLHEIFDRTIDSHVRNIRRKIELLGVDETLIDSVYGSGYRYNPLA
jgi:two-component system response regulator BaeR